VKICDLLKIVTDGDGRRRPGTSAPRSTASRAPTWPRPMTPTRSPGRPGPWRGHAARVAGSSRSRFAAAPCAGLRLAPAVAAARPSGV